MVPDPYSEYRYGSGSKFVSKNGFNLDLDPQHCILISMIGIRSIIPIFCLFVRYLQFSGKGGAKLQELEKVTATKITIPKPHDNRDSVTITGTKEGIEKALHEIQTISDEQSKQAFERMDVPKIYHPFIQGPNNELVNKLTAAHPGVRINIPPLSVQKDELSIAGEKEGVLAVKDHIGKLWKELERKCATVSVEVKKSQHRYRDSHFLNWGG